NVWASLPEAGARCNSIARRDLCGGPRGNSGPYRDLSVSANLIMFTVVLGVGMAYLFTQHDLKTYETVGALLLLGLAGGLSGVLLIGLWLPSLLRSVLQWLQETVSRIAQRFQRHPPLPHDWAEKTTCEFAEAASAVRAHPRRLANTLCAALAAHALDLATLYVLFLAFRHSIDFGPLVAGYAMGILFWIVSPTPEGIGVVEGVMTLVYTSLDVPGSVALVVSVAFRGITFWLPLLLGFLVIRKTESFRSGRG
ncbi:MAG: flippase-like domain-containing protein, partial [Chloroflexi bacterium]|nr:flippase-like domain-containing protein [Chloroflexota bacterium]